MILGQSKRVRKKRAGMSADGPPTSMSKKTPRIAERIERFRAHPSGYDPHYLGYFDCFNAGLYYEAHDVLEELWLPCRGQADDLFYKGLIQLAGAFVHFQKGRLGPGVALLKLAVGNFVRYPSPHHGFDHHSIERQIQAWILQASAGASASNPLATGPAPRLSLALWK